MKNQISDRKSKIIHLIPACADSLVLSHRALLVIATAAFLTGVRFVGAQENAGAAKSEDSLAAVTSRTLLEKQLESTLSKIELLESEKKSLEAAAQKISKLKDTTRIRAEDLQPATDELRKAARDLKEFNDRQAKGGDLIGTNQVSSFITKFEALQMRLLSAARPLFTAMDSMRRDLGEKVLDQIRDIVSENYDSVSLDKKLPKCSLLAGTLSRLLGDRTKLRTDGTILPGVDLRVPINDAADEASKINANFAQELLDSFTQKLQATFDQVGTALTTEISQRDSSLKEQKERETKLNQQLAAIEKKQQKQVDINEKLVWAVFGMIAAIVTLFAVLRIFPAQLAESIVSERTMIELLSMGFLLLTIIILGTAKLITGETLGALLGTIAGYIFGRKEAERKVASEPIQRGVGGVADANVIATAAPGAIIPASATP